MLPLENIKVLEFTHAVMGPSAGMILADLGAEVIHIEPPEGDATRRLKGFGIGYFPYFSRNKKSLALDLKSEDGRRVIMDLLADTDVLLENFGPGTMDRLGYGYDALAKQFPQLIYCALKGFLSGPYENRPAMDEVVQMMGGLAYMTGPPGQPLRAGASVVDITGGMFGVIAVQAALLERSRTGMGRFVKAGLFETTAFLMGQHMAVSALTQTPVPPMPARVSAWSVYRTFVSKDKQTVFIGLVSDRHWQRFCDAFNRPDLRNDPTLAANNQRIDHADRLLPDLEHMLAAMTATDIIARCEAANIPFAPITRPEDLFDDPHLHAGGRLLETTIGDGITTQLPRLPLEWDGESPDLRSNPPSVGSHTREILDQLGYDSDNISHLCDQGVVACS